LKLTGWSEKIFEIMEQSEIKPQAMVEEIEKLEI